jgi:hypothetical protein
MTGDHISASVDGSVQGQFAVGKDISQTQVTGGAVAALSPEQQAQLAAIFENLRARVTAEAPPDLRASANERVGELEEALTAEAPDLTTVQYVKHWFARNLPRIAGSVTSLLVHPLVGKLVEAGGDALVSEFAEIARD